MIAKLYGGPVDGWEGDLSEVALRPDPERVCFPWFNDAGLTGVFYVLYARRGEELFYRYEPDHLKLHP